MGIEKVIKPSRGEDYENKLLQRGCFGIYTFNTLSSSGLNIKILILFLYYLILSFLIVIEPFLFVDY